MSHLIKPEPVSNSKIPAFNIPLVIVIFIGVFAAIHFYRESLNPIADFNALTRFGFIPRLFFSDIWHVSVSVWFSTLSYAFLHGNMAHLVLNSLWFLAFGSVVARYLGAGLFVLFFALTAVFSALAYGALHPLTLAPLIGASGSVSATMAAALLMSPENNNGLMPLRAAIFDKRFLITVGIWIAINVFSGFGANSTMVDENVNIAWEAHLAGFFAGLLLIGILGKVKQRNGLI
jgi:membrane associated rhomboid family serine protease